MATRSVYKNRAADLEAERQERQDMIAEARGVPAATLPSMPDPFNLSAIAPLEPVALKDESPMMVSAPPSGHGGGGKPVASDYRRTVDLTREQAEFATKYCGISTQEYARQLEKHRHLKTIDPDRYGGTG